MNDNLDDERSNEEGDDDWETDQNIYAASMTATQMNIPLNNNTLF